jgi:hypothetical protein
VSIARPRRPFPWHRKVPAGAVRAGAPTITVNRTRLLLLLLSTPAAWAATSTAKPAAATGRPHPRAAASFSPDSARAKISPPRPPALWLDR